MTTTGEYRDHGVHAIISIELFHFTIKPSHWDTLLSVQQKFGHDFNDLIFFIDDARRRREPIVSQSEAQSPPQPLLHSGVLNIKGFRIGLEGRTHTAYLECQDVDGGFRISAGRTWRLDITGLALTLAPRSDVHVERLFFNGNHRSAFVTIDIKTRISSVDNVKALSIIITKIHAVLQPSSIGEIGDFMDNLQASYSRGII